MEFAKQHACEILSAIGCGVSEIPEADGRRADLRATDTSSSYVIEVKHKFDDFEVFRDHVECMASGEVVSRSESTSRNNRIDGILKDGREQLEKTPAPENEFRLIWFFSGGIDRDLHWKRAFATFYGFVQLIALDPPSDNIVDCFYFDFSAAWSMPSVDAMVLTDGNDLQLCLNEFSDRVDIFANTDLCQKLSDAVVDPRRLLADGSIITLRSTLSRKHEETVLDALANQTGVRYTALRPKQHSASAMIANGNATEQSGEPERD